VLRDLAGIGASPAESVGCRFLGPGNKGTLIGVRDKYVLAHWPSLGEDLWVPSRAVVCEPAVLKLRFICTNN
jgi:hypothetical protein